MFNSKPTQKKGKKYRNQNKKNKKGRDLIVLLACDERAELRMLMHDDGMIGGLGVD